MSKSTKKAVQSTQAQTTYKNKWLESFIDNNYALVNCVPGTKVALEKAWSQIKPDPTWMVEDFPDNYGVVLAGEDLIIDCDPRNFITKVDGKLQFVNGKPVPDKWKWPEDLPELKDGEVDDPFQRLLDEYKIDVNKAFTVKTGGGGSHTYLTKPKDLRTRMTDPRYPGIEFKTKGHYVVGPGSLHPDTGAMYKVLAGAPHRRQDAPTELLDRLEQHNLGTGMNVLINADDDPQAHIRFMIYLKNCPPAIEGQYGQIATIKAACFGKDYGLSEDIVFELMVEHYNPRCAPPFEVDELKTLVNNAFKYGREPQGSRHAKAAFGEPDEEEKQYLADRTEAFKKLDAPWDVEKRSGRFKPTLGNIVYLFRLPDYGLFVNPVHKLIRFNQYTQEIEFNYAAPWHLASEKRRIWTDDDTIQFEHWLSETHYMNPPGTTALKAAIVYARQFGYHPIQQYLNEVQWDGVPRLANLLIHYCGAKDSKYNQHIAIVSMVGAVARIFEPGCKLDTMLVLEGKQGIGKSTFVRTLASDRYFTDFSLDPHNKDTVQGLIGKWISEASEMDQLKRADASALKAFLSRLSDRIRLPYGRITQDFPRQFAIIGTINPEANIGYLSDRTGNRRYLPCPVRYVRLEQLKQDRDQLWAEAVHLYRQGTPWHLTDPEVIAEAERAVSDRVDSDPWEETIAHWINSCDDPPTVLTTTEIAQNALHIQTQKIARYEQIRIAHVMASLGWEKGKFHHPTQKRTLNGFKRQFDETADDL